MGAVPKAMDGIGRGVREVCHGLADSKRHSGRRMIVFLPAVRRERNLFFADLIELLEPLVWNLLWKFRLVAVGMLDDFGDGFRVGCGSEEALHPGCPCRWLQDRLDFLGGRLNVHYGLLMRRLGLPVLPVQQIHWPPSGMCNVIGFRGNLRAEEHLLIPERWRQAAIDHGLRRRRTPRGGASTSGLAIGVRQTAAARRHARRIIASSARLCRSKSFRQARGSA
mmetsp:Transcript_107899/g.310915  ORF Transcript_107899/g.310915 Transcript_107899/m.310915 type:complete len:223 (-) Transcript_107899:2263-2931(-)